MVSFISSVVASINAGKAVSVTAEEKKNQSKRENPGSEFPPDTSSKNHLPNSFLDKFGVFKKSGLKELKKRTNPNFERFARNYIEDEPEILFTAEYYVENKFLGVLVAWEQYFSSTHYEVFKKNMFQSDSRFERVLFLDEASLREETKRFIPYLKNTLGFDDLEENNVFVILDHHVKVDRIYEYEVGAARVPELPLDVDFDLILETNDLLNFLVLDRNSSTGLFDLAASSLGSQDLAWVIALVNEYPKFFGRGVVENALWTFIRSEGFEDDEFKIGIPKNINDVLCIIEESTSLFGIKRTIIQVALNMGGLPKIFIKALSHAIDEDRNVFSYENFRDIVKSNMSVYKLILTISESGTNTDQLSSLSIVVPLDEGSESLISLEGLSRIFNFVNDTFIAVMYAQEKKTFEKLQDILLDIEKSKEQESSEDHINEAINELRDNISDQNKDISEETSDSLDIQVGGKAEEQGGVSSGASVITSSKKISVL